MDLGLKDKVVMVAASSKGLGYGIALEAAREGAILSLGSRNQKNLKSAAERIEREAPGAKIIISQLDIVGDFLFAFHFYYIHKSDIAR